MNILYFSDNYALNVAGTKISIFNEMKKRGHNLLWVDKNFFIKNQRDLNILIDEFNKLINKNKTNQVWLAHSNLVIPIELKKYLNSKDITVIGFGMSDPYYFDPKKRLPFYNIYITNSYLVSGKYRNVIPTIYNPTACDLSFHKKLEINKKYPTSIIGRGLHPRFTEEDMRHKDIRFLLKNNIKSHTFGSDWFNHKYNHKPVIGNEFLRVINQTYLGLDLQDTFSPLAHRMMEYSACGTPIITRKRDEVLLHFNENKEIIFYDSRDELLDKINYYLRRSNLLECIGTKAKLRCEKDHNISNRVNNIFKRLNKIMGENF